MVIHDIYSVSTLTYLHFSQVRKPIFDNTHHNGVVAVVLLLVLATEAQDVI